jgi:hypothetical protein
LCGSRFGSSALLKSIYYGYNPQLQITMTIKQDGYAAVQPAAVRGDAAVVDRRLLGVRMANLS